MPTDNWELLCEWLRVETGDDCGANDACVDVACASGGLPANPTCAGYPQYAMVRVSPAVLAELDIFACQTRECSDLDAMAAGCQYVCE